ATLAADRDPGADRRDRSSSAKPPSACRARRPGLGALSFARERSGQARRKTRAGLGLPHRAENESFVDHLAEPGRELEDGDVRPQGMLDIESINPTCVVWSAGCRIRPPAIQ